jgi:hypothetical protein
VFAMSTLTGSTDSAHCRRIGITSATTSLLQIYRHHINYKLRGNYFNALIISIANSVSRLASTTLVLTSFPSTIQTYNSLNSRL